MVIFPWQLYFKYRRFIQVKFVFLKNGNLLTYSTIKQALIEEFSKKFLPIDLKRQPQKRKLGNSKTLFEYFLAMRKIASRGHFFADNKSLINYYTNGIPDSSTNKEIFYA